MSPKRNLIFFCLIYKKPIQQEIIDKCLSNYHVDMLKDLYLYQGQLPQYTCG